MDHAHELVGRAVVGEEEDGRVGLRHRPSWLERSVAAATASMNADRTALNSRVRSAAAVVPPGEVTAARSSRGVLAGLGHHPGRAEHGAHHQAAAHLPGEAGGHPAVDHGLGHQEDVGRARARDTGHRVEVALGQPDHRAHRPEDPLGPVEVGGGGLAPSGDGGHPRPDQGRGVGHGPDHHVPRAEGRLQPGRRQAGHDREHPADPDGGQGAQHRLGHVRLDGQDGAVGLDGDLHDLEPGVGLGQARRAGSGRDRSPPGRQPGPSRPAIRPVSRAEPIFPPPTTRSFGCHRARRYQWTDRPPAPFAGIAAADVGSAQVRAGLRPTAPVGTVGGGGTGPRSRWTWPSGSTRRCRPARPP